MTANYSLKLPIRILFDLLERDDEGLSLVLIGYFLFSYPDWQFLRIQ